MIKTIAQSELLKMHNRLVVWKQIDATLCSAHWATLSIYLVAIIVYSLFINVHIHIMSNKFYKYNSKIVV